MFPMLLSALDQSPVFEDRSPSASLQESIRVAQACDTLGYNRYWVAEHHGSSSFAGCSPEILISAIAQQTNAIKVGSGGVMLSHYSPYKVAETFKTLSALYPSRIDLGIGRAPGGDPWQSGALAYGSPTTTVDFYTQKVLDLHQWLHEQKPHTEAFHKVKITPNLGDNPNLCILAATQSSVDMAVQTQSPLALAHFIQDSAAQLGPIYKKQWQDSGNTGKAHTILAVFCILADTEEQAIELSAPGAWWRRNIRMGFFKPFRTTEVAVRYLDRADAQWRTTSALTDDGSPRLIGTQESVVDTLRQLIATSGADELMAVTICEQESARVHSYKLLKELVDSLL